MKPEKITLYNSVGDCWYGFKGQEPRGYIYSTPPIVDKKTGTMATRPVSNNGNGDKKPTPKK